LERKSEKNQLGVFEKVKKSGLLLVRHQKYKIDFVESAWG